MKSSVKINTEFIDKAKTIAHRCTFKRHNNGAIIVRGDEVISLGWAHMSHIRLNTTSSLHAEVHALSRARHIDLDNAVAYVAAISRKSGNITNGRPCLTCSIAMYNAGIRYAVYTIDKSNYGILDLSKDLSKLKVYKPHRSLIGPNYDTSI